MSEYARTALTTWKAYMGVLLLWQASIVGVSADESEEIGLGMLILSETLQARLGDDNLVILHAARDSITYATEHLPGARLALWEDYAIEVDGIPNELPPLDALTDWLQRMGVDQESRIVIYDEGNVLLASRLFFTLDYLGLGGRTALLDGGLDRWRMKGRPLTDEAPIIERSHFVPTPQEYVLIDWEEIARLSDQKISQEEAPFTILDTRSEQQFKPDEPNGAIPGALQLYWRDSIKEGHLRPDHELKDLFDHAGVKEGQPVLVYCNSGVQASYLYFVAKHLGYDVRLYDGSMSEWRLKNQESKEK